MLLLGWLVVLPSKQEEGDERLEARPGFKSSCFPLVRLQPQECNAHPGSDIDHHLLLGARGPKLRSSGGTTLTQMMTEEFTIAAKAITKKLFTKKVF